MGCPDIDQLIDLFYGRGNREVDDHVRICPSCQADMEVLFLLPSAMSFDLEVPESLVERVLAAAPKPAPEVREEYAPVGQRLATGVLGFATIAVALVASGSVGAGSPLVFLILSLGSGAITGYLHRWFGHWVEDLGPRRLT